MQLILVVIKPCCPIGLMDAFLSKNRTWNGPGLSALFLSDVMSVLYFSLK